jgi:hypothetical protein
MRKVLTSLAFVVVAASSGLAAGGPPTVEFSGYTWQVRDYGGGPGPNSWSASNVFIDEDGLHLRISQVDGAWSAAEVIMTAPLGFGTYSFDVAGQPDRLDKNVVLGLFSYPGSPDIGPDGTNEIDIEFAQWGKGKTKSRLHWTAHAPLAGVKVAQQSQVATIGEEGSSHSYHWSADALTFSWINSGSSGKPKAWTYAPKSAARHVPQQPLVVHINLWLFGGKPPSDGKPVEVVIRSFRFTPD